MGPNMEVKLSNGNSKILNGIDDATMAAVQLELALEETNTSYQMIPKLLIAASKVMERAIQSQGRSTTVLSSRMNIHPSLWRTTATFFRVAI
jgi:hypothetical protein